MLKELKAYKAQCDRCGGFIENISGEGLYANANDADTGVCEFGWSRITVETGTTKTYHLCPNCTSEFINTMDKLLSFKKEK